MEGQNKNAGKNCETKVASARYQKYNEFVSNGGKCSSCFSVFKKLQTYKIHTQQEYKCDDCNLVYKCELGLQYHIANNHFKKSSENNTACDNSKEIISGDNPDDNPGDNLGDNSKEIITPNESNHYTVL